MKVGNFIAKLLVTNMIPELGRHFVKTEQGIVSMKLYGSESLVKMYYVKKIL